MREAIGLPNLRIAAFYVHSDPNTKAAPTDLIRVELRHGAREVQILDYLDAWRDDDLRPKVVALHAKWARRLLLRPKAPEWTLRPGVDRDVWIDLLCYAISIPEYLRRQLRYGKKRKLVRLAPPRRGRLLNRLSKNTKRKHA